MTLETWRLHRQVKGCLRLQHKCFLVCPHPPNRLAHWPFGRKNVLKVWTVLFFFCRELKKNDICCYLISCIGQLRIHTYIYKHIYDIFSHSQYITVNTWMHGGFWATRSFPPASSLTAGSLRCCIARCLWNKSCKTHSDTWHLLSQRPGEGNYDRPSTCTADWPLLMKPRPSLHIFEFQNAVKCWSDGGAKSQTSQHAETVLRVVKRFSKDLRWSHCETGRLLEQRPQGHHGLSPIVPFFLWCPTSWRSVRNFKTRTVISPQSEPMLMMHEGHYVHIQTSSSSFLFFTRWGWATLRQRLDGGPLALCSHIK